MYTYPNASPMQGTFHRFPLVSLPSTPSLLMILTVNRIEIDVFVPGLDITHFIRLHGEGEGGEEERWGGGFPRFLSKVSQQGGTGLPLTLSSLLFLLWATALGVAEL